MKKCHFILFVSFLFLNLAKAQENEVDFTKFNTYNQMNMGAMFNSFGGTISEFISRGGGGNIDFNAGKDKLFYGFTMQFLATNKKKDFTTPPGYVHYEQPSIMTFGVHWGFVSGQHQKSHFRTSIGLAYSWIYHKKIGTTITTYNGISPSIEFSRSFKFGNVSYSAYQYTSNFSPPVFNPTFRNKYIDVFIGYKRLIMNNKEGNGNLFSMGVKYLINDYSIAQNRPKPSTFYEKK